MRQELRRPDNCPEHAHRPYDFRSLKIGQFDIRRGRCAPLNVNRVRPESLDD